MTDIVKLLDALFTELNNLGSICHLVNRFLECYRKTTGKFKRKVKHTIAALFG